MKAAPTRSEVARYFLTQAQTQLQTLTEKHDAWKKGVVVETNKLVG